MKKKVCLASLALCFFLFGSTGVSLAQQGQGTPNGDLLDKMMAEGWRLVSPGVLQRNLRVNEVETFMFGVEGFTWKYEELLVQFEKMRKDYRDNPTPELRQAITNHQKEMANTLRMIRRARAAEERGVTAIPKVDCILNYSYNANASYLTGSQGTWASASSSFSANSGCLDQYGNVYTGSVYAYAESRVTVNGGSTLQTYTDGPRSGSNVSASAYASLNGGESCSSYAYASVTSNNLNPSSYSRSASNYSCPAPPPDIVISSGPASVNLLSVFCRTVTWYSSVTGGVGSLSYSWTVDGWQEGTGSSFTKTVCRGDYSYNGGFNLAVTVTDGLGRSDTDSRFVAVYEPSCTDPCYCSSPDTMAPIEPCYANPQ